ncbi:unnamed protein product [[Actinomadura] parvosata subsp. kistnae]|nr:unnamed protein product [Actinomadura parvosata subsp. kistnae]
MTLLAAVMFFTGPALAFAAGDRAAEIENRRLPAFPDLSRGWAAVPEVEAWATAHLPLRRQAVRGHAALSEIVGGSGRRLVFTVAPDKTTISPGHLPARFPGRACLRQRKQEFWAALKAARLPGYLDLREPLERSQRETGTPAYWRTDSHWTERSAGLYGSELARTLQPGLSRHTRLSKAGQAPRDGDLGGLLGIPTEEVIERWRLVRDGVRRLRQDDRELPVSSGTVNTSDRAPLYRPDGAQRQRSPRRGPDAADRRLVHPQLAAVATAVLRRSDLPAQRRAGHDRGAGHRGEGRPQRDGGGRDRGAPAGRRRARPARRQRARRPRPRPVDPRGGASRGLPSARVPDRA